MSLLTEHDPVMGYMGLMMFLTLYGLNGSGARQTDILVLDCSISSALAMEILQSCINTLRPRQNARYFEDAILKCIFLDGNISVR